MLKRLLPILSHPAFISLILTVITIVLLPPIFNRYKAKLVDKQILPSSQREVFHDLDHDGYSEKLKIFDVYSANSSILIMTKEKIFHHWPLHKKLFDHGQVYFGDFNNNGYDEIYVFTHDSSTIYINIFEPFPDLVTHIEDRPIYQVYYNKHNTIDNQIVSSLFEDLNGDGSKEIILSLMTGWTGKPRQTIAYDLRNDTLYFSQKCGVCLYDSYTYDIDGDGVNEILGSTHAYNNCKDLPYSDSSTWLMILNNKLDFFFEPVEIGKHPASLMVRPLVHNNESYLVVFNQHRGINDTSSLLLFNKDGIQLKERKILHNIDIENSFLISGDLKNRNVVYHLYGNGEIDVIDNDLSVVGRIKTKIKVFSMPKRIDIDHDGEKEIIIQSDGNLTITRSDFSHPTALEFSSFAKGLLDYSIISKGPDKSYVFIRKDNRAYTFHYSKNSLFFLKYFFYLALYFLIFLIVWLIRKSQEYTLIQKFKTKQLIAELQLKSIQNQINPHFTLNVLNSIGTLFYKKDIETAEYVFDKYSKLLKSTVISSEDFIITLSHEIDYVDNYLKIEKFRFEEKFDYKISVDDKVDIETNIPKMLIYTFVENSIKHGIRHLMSDGYLNINIIQKSESIIIEVEDNGVGRKKAAEYVQFSTGKGLKILDQIIQLYYDLEKVKIFYKIKDLFDNFNNPKGTQVVITIPLSNSTT